MVSFSVPLRIAWQAASRMSQSRLKSDVSIQRRSVIPARKVPLPPVRRELPGGGDRLESGP